MFPNITIIILNTQLALIKIGLWNKCDILKIILHGFMEPGLKFNYLLYRK